MLISDLAHGGPMSETITVTELNTRVKELFGAAPGVRDLWVAGELSNVKCYPSGHYYFTIKDLGSEVRAVMFRNSRARIGFEPADSMKVQAYGSVDMYVQRGSYQFVVENMRASGTGDLWLRYEALKKKLEAEGLFDDSRKRPLPAYPKVIGVVTSPAGAVIHDIVTTSGRMFPADILLAPAKVQGEGAAESIAAGIELLNRAGADVIIVGRGGGSIEDLWAFNEEAVARAIAASKAPVISSVGHETDFTIADFVADKRAATPTAAAEMALRDRREILREIAGYGVRLDRALSAVVERMRARFGAADYKLSPRKAEEAVAAEEMRLDDLSRRAASALGAKASEMHRRFARAEAGLAPALRSLVKDRRAEARALSDALGHAMSVLRAAARSRFERAAAGLGGLDPNKVLDRGYSYVTGPDGRAITSVGSMEVGSLITVRMRDGSADAEIKRKEMNVS